MMYLNKFDRVKCYIFFVLVEVKYYYSEERRTSYCCYSRLYHRFHLHFNEASSLMFF